MARTRGRRRSDVQPLPARASAVASRAARPALPQSSDALRLRLLGAVMVGTVAFVLYLLTVARDIFPGDSPEFVTVALSGGVAHPPGYPLLSVIGALFGQLPIGPLPFRVNILSALAHAATVSVVFLIAERLTRNVLAATAAALVLAFGRLFWSWSLVAEAFPLNDLLAACVLYFLVVWHEQPTRRAPLFAAAIAFGLGMANHQTISLLVPGFLAIVLDRRRELRGRSSLLVQAAGVAILTTALPYAYIPIAAARHELWNWGGVASPLDLVRQFLRLDYGTGQLLPDPRYQGGTGFDRLTEFVKNFNPLLALLVALGAAQAWLKVRWYFWASALMLFITGPVFLSYANANVQDATARFVLIRFYLLPQVVVAPLAALGLVLAGELIRRRWYSSPRWIPAALAGLACAATAVTVTVNYRGVDRSSDHVAHDFAIDLFATTPQDAILLAGGDHVVFPLVYAQAIEGARPDVTVIIISLLPHDWYQRELRLRHPELNIPLARFEDSDGLKQLMQANLGRNFLLTGEQSGQSFGGLYGVYGRGLLLPVIGPNAQLDLNAVRADNEKLIASYHVPSLDNVDRESFERFIVDWYALVPFRLGSQFEQARQFSEARTWYQRALAIQPQLPEAIAGMQRIAGK